MHQVAPGNWGREGGTWIDRPSVSFGGWKRESRYVCERTVSSTMEWRRQTHETPAGDISPTREISTVLLNRCNDSIREILNTLLLALDLDENKRPSRLYVWWNYVRNNAYVCDYGVRL